MAVPLLDLRAQHATIKDEMIRAVMGVIEPQTFILGEPVNRLESAVAALSHTKFAVGCASETNALLLAMRALDIGRGNEVITTPFTFFATAGTIHNVGATPVFVDIDPVTFNIDPALVAQAVTARTRAVIPVDLFGQWGCSRTSRPKSPVCPRSRMRRSPSVRGERLTGCGAWPAKWPPSALSVSSPPRTWAPMATAV